VKRRTIAVDRLACALAGAALVAGGLAAAAWARGDLPVPADSALSIPNLDSVFDAFWWPYALGAAALVLIAVGVRWLLSHRPGQTPGPAPLPGSTGTAPLTVDLNSAAAAAAASLSEHPHVRSASGHCRADRGQRVIEIDLKIDPRTDLGELTSAIDDTRRDLDTALAGVSFSSRILLSAARGSTARVS